LHNYGIKTCLVRRDDPLAVLLGALPEWKLLYSDNVSVLLVRIDGDDGNVPQQ
jgi:hypothetical protein